VRTFRAGSLFIVTAENKELKAVVTFFTLIFINGHEQPPNFDFLGPNRAKV
jgi:hypothetical protein